ncbi:MAG: L-2-hydroxyglutarate oxidase LhgO [Candidatus Accumulibacter sp. BA-94]|jgi:L-2-hydroxyglutarate oxidase LhgO|uniref:NAD(P)/FAD-dependent oxidoreductase n=1 Tax=Accumulibacter sp. TaxID=2053492 RepID=UPI000452FAC9|nr:NAD(P)/FAD-dependent oxidoreductase [Accumulibacter sp.]EXI90335.1 MAG: L-2-hydroxyglutarate oxidase LhgO [Candidatus Accumulibacter sp. BA-94]MBL8390532.1 NAD(P)/FAD-dependent oxidoreductase [Accumulibacter sp.]HRD88097.1 NAD(P)/FAD-dependent oxidoreductase [Accumulibacter sp.]
MERIGAAVIGAGVIGLACARELARRGIETLIIERSDDFGRETSSRNSEVIHAGLYYPGGSLKATLCVAGRRQLYDFCRSHAVRHRRCGKLIVATAGADEERLAALQTQGEANGVDDLRWLSSAEARALEPELACTAALLSPSTGIIDSHGLMLALLGDAEHAGALLARRSPLLRGVIEPTGIVLECGGDDSLLLHCALVVNAAGPWAADVAASLAGFPAAALPAMHYAKGNYCALAGRPPFSRLVYPLPGTGGLGIHLTLDLAGQARFGPDVEWLTDPPPGVRLGAFDYRVSDALADSFQAEIRRYWPGLTAGSLQPAYAGVRPKLAGPAEPAADFLIQGPAQHGIPGLVNLFGIESPGLTACLAIADRVAAELQAK